MSQNAAGRPPVAPATPVPRITVSQSALFFPTPITTHVENSVDFTNAEDSLVLFKVKTSDVNRYVVRPKVGIIQPRATATVRFVLLAEHLKNVEDAKGDRFSVHVRFARKGEKLNDPAACWAADSTTDARLNFPCKFVGQGELPDGISCKLEQPTPGKSSGGRRARSHTPRAAEQTPRSVAGSPATAAAAAAAAAGGEARDAINATQTQAANKIGDPSSSALAAARQAKRSGESTASQAKSSYQAATATAVKRVDPVTISGALASVRSNGSQPSSPAAPAGAKTTSSPAASATGPRKVAGSRKSAFAQAFTPSIPTVIVIPLMLACFAAGVYSEQWMVHVEEWLKYVQLMMRVLSTPAMQQ